MKNIAELHTTHLDVLSELNFLKKEIEFLLKIVQKGYSVSANMEKVKLLDAYWIGFEKNLDKLSDLSNTISKEEKNIAALYQNNLIDEEKTLFREDGLMGQFYRIYKEVKTLKDSFYDSLHVTDVIVKNR